MKTYPFKSIKDKVIVKFYGKDNERILSGGHKIIIALDDSVEHGYRQGEIIDVNDKFLSIGDKVVVKHVAVEESDRLDEDVFSITRDMIYCVDKGEGLVPMEDWAIIKPIPTTYGSHITLLRDDNVAEVVSIGNHNNVEYEGISVGLKVYYIKPFRVPVDVQGYEKFFVIRLEDILAEAE